MKVVVCIPTHDRWVSDFGMSLAFLVDEIHANPPPGLTHFTMATRKSSLLPVQRHWLAEYAVKEGATHILWFDTDMCFPRKALHMLAKHKQPIVGANYSKKFGPYLHTAQGMDDKPIITRKDSTGLTPAKHLGFGCLLVETRVFKEVPTPWFPIGWEPNAKTYFGEDVFFFHAARKAGFQPYVDHDLSKQVMHFGDYAYTTDLYEEIEADKAEHAKWAAE